jgi:hypothetical protein
MLEMVIMAWANKRDFGAVDLGFLMPGSAQPEPLNAARAFEATLAPLAAHRPQTGGDGGIQPAHRDNSSATLIASCLY